MATYRRGQWSHKWTSVFRRLPKIYGGVFPEIGSIIFR
jgi:hypothetical protein